MKVFHNAALTTSAERARRGLGPGAGDGDVTVPCVGRTLHTPQCPPVRLLDAWLGSIERALDRPTNWPACQTNNPTVNKTNRPGERNTAGGPDGLRFNDRPADWLAWIAG